MKFPSFANFSFKDSRLYIGSAASAGARITTVASMVVIMAIASRVMTKEEFGLWAILVTFIYLSWILDFGFRYGMGNRLAAWVASAGGKTTTEQRELYLSIFYFQCLIGIVLSLIYLAVAPFLPWIEIFKIHQAELVSTVPLLMNVVCISLFLNIPFMLMGTGFFAFQEINLVCAISAAQSVLLLILFGIASLILTFKEVIICYFVAYLLTNVAGTVWFMIKRGWPLVWISWPQQWQHIRSLANRSLEFFVLSLSATAVAAIGTFLAGAVAGLSKAGDFNLVQRIFGFVITLHLALLAPLAPAFTQAAQLGQWESVRGKFSFCQYRIWPLLFSGGCGLIYLLHPVILKIWSGRPLSDFTLAGIMALTAILGGWGNTQSVLLNSLGLVKWQAIISVMMAPLFIFLPLYMGKTWGIIGIAAGTLLCMIPGTIFWSVYARYALRRKLLRV
ncbi:MAG: lipopolysaccharide biosynthesis protein [Syntrophales bacterium]